MAFNPSSQVAVARDAASKLGAEQVIVVYVNHSTGKIGMASYGQTRALCSQAGKLGDVLYARAREWFANQ
jgi:hypothetical protein